MYVLLLAMPSFSFGMDTYRNRQMLSSLTYLRERTPSIQEYSCVGSFIKEKALFSVVQYGISAFNASSLSPTELKSWGYRS